MVPMDPNKMLSCLVITSIYPFWGIDELDTFPYLSHSCIVRHDIL
jgi:hypothetical protein